MVADVNWKNWAGNQMATSSGVTHPRNSREVALLVVDAAERGFRLRPIGSGHSFSAIASPDGAQTVQVVLDRCAELVSLDRSTGLVTVQAGMTLRRLNRLLAETGLALPNLGKIEEQTVAGAISTGTHGTGARFGSIATQVRGLEIVCGDGEVVTCSTSERADLFAAARVGLGALGVITTVTLQAEPLFAVRAEEGPMRLDVLLESFDELAATVDYVECYWFPHTRWTHVKRHTRQSMRDGLAPLPPIRRWWDDELLSSSMFRAMVAAGRLVPKMIQPLAKVSSRALRRRTFTDLPFKTFTSPRPIRFKEMEYGVPREALLDVFRELVSAVRQSDLSVSLPVQLRVAAADDIPLSTASGWDVGYVAVHVDHRTPHERYFDLVEVIMKDAGGRPHWGKLHSLDAADLRERYPRFDEFLEIRAKADPHGIFANAYLDCVLGPISSAG